MTFFDRFIFVVENRFNNVINRINNQNRQQQFAMFVKFYKIIILFFHFANSTRTTFKRFFNDVINIVNNVSFKKRDRKTKYRKNSIFVSQSIFYNFISFQFVIVRFRQKIRRFERLTSRVFFVFQLLSQKDDDDDDFDLFFSRFYIDFYDHDFDFDFDDETKIILSSQLTKKRFVQRQRNNDIRESTKRIKSNDRTRIRSRVRKSKSKNTRDDIKLNFDYFNVRKLDFIFISHVLSKLRIDKNVCFFCKIYRYFEKRDKNFNKQY